ncbi:ADP-ribosylglycohydrolase family protein [Corynebacterium pacaense]|uniref:ADP-ribosylglycohydrolase family protein n=1 Tax=Corynebacterium pacaense TaxID=1816684 RepID=UPI0009B9DA0F|nr:ADP-ribosylglycohydrolase family protein [Corynebacterium pacaense]
MSSESRAQAVLLGQLIGDSLGSQVEFATAAEISEHHPGGVVDLADGGPFSLRAGQPTDDSEMALALARSILRNGGFSVDDVLESYTRWARSGPFDIGATTSAALMDHRRDGASQANGALMRICPLAIYMAPFPGETAEELARIDAALTHPNQLCQDINAVFVRVIAAAIYREYDRPAMLDAFREHSAGEVRDLIEASVVAPPAEFQESMGWVRIAFGNAIFELANGTSLEQSLIRTVGRGGDTDTNAAICGALLGGLYGVQGLPRRWIDPVLSARADVYSPRPRPEEYWPVDAPDLALGLLRIATA